MAGDKGYSLYWIRTWLRRRRIRPVIAQKSDQVGRRDGNRGRFAKRTYRRRNVVERCVGWLKNCRRVATRYEKLAVSYLAMLKVAIAGRILKMRFSNGT